MIEANIWTCISCKDAEGVSQAEIVLHLKRVHGVDAREKKARREMLMHMDGADFYIFEWKWTIGGVEINNFVKGRRPKDDPMRNLE